MISQDYPFDEHKELSAWMGFGQDDLKDEERNTRKRPVENQSDFSPKKRRKISFSFSPPVWYDETQLPTTPIYKNVLGIGKVEKTSQMGLYYLVYSMKKEKEVCIISKQDFNEENYLQTFEDAGELNFVWYQNITLSSFDTIEDVLYEGTLRVHPDLTNKLKNCLENRSKKIILIPLDTHFFILNNGNQYVYEILETGGDIRGYPRDYVKSVGHRVMIIINKYLKTVEFYDPNGSGGHQLMVGNYDYEKVSTYLKETFPEYFKDYDILSYEDTCPKQAFQYFEAMQRPLMEPFELGGFCQFWSVFNAHMRMKYPEIPAMKLQEEILKKMQYNKPYGYFSAFIKNYAIFLQEMVYQMS